MFIENSVLGLVFVFFLSSLLAISYYFMKSVKVTASERKFLRVFLLGLSFMTSYSMYLSYGGWKPLFEDGSDIWVFQNIYPYAAAMFFGYFSFVIWLVLYNWIIVISLEKAESVKKAQIKFAAFFTVFVVSVIFLFSTLIGVQGLSLKDVKTLKLSNASEKINIQFKKSTDYRQDEVAIIADLGKYSKYFLQEGEKEILKWHSSQSKDESTVYSYLLSISSLLKTSRERLIDVSQKAGKEQLLVLTKLNQMNLYSLKDFNKKLSNLMRLNSELTEINLNASYAASREIELGSIENLVLIEKFYSINSTESDKARIEQYHVKFKEIVAELSSKSKSLIARKFSQPSIQPLDITDEVFNNWGELLPFWIFAFFVDFCPLLFLLMTAKNFMLERSENLQESC